MPFNVFILHFFSFVFRISKINLLPLERMREAISMFYYMCYESNLKREVFHYVYLRNVKALRRKRYCIPLYVVFCV